MIPARTLNTPPKPWSWSALDSFETCPRRHYELKVAKSVREKPSQALVYGREVHDALDKRVKYKISLPSDLQPLEPKVAALEKMGGIIMAEEELALTQDLKKTDWFGRNVWVRLKIDVQVHLGTSILLGDWKTGKMSDDWGQLITTAHLKFQLHPQLETAGLFFIWTKYNDKSRRVVTREEAALEWANNLMPRVAKYQRAFDINEFPEKPSGLCRNHCPVKACQHNG